MFRRMFERQIINKIEDETEYTFAYDPDVQFKNVDAIYIDFVLKGSAINDDFNYVDITVVGFLSENGIHISTLLEK